MPEWFSIEVIDGSFAAARWAESHGDDLIWLAQDHGATDWHWADHTWGVVLELELPDEVAWEEFLASAGVRAALDAVPDPAFGLITYRGRGGSSGSRQPRKPKPFAGAGAASLPMPLPDDLVDDLLESATTPRPLVLNR